MKPTLSIVILNYKSKEYALGTITSIEETCSAEVTSGEYEIIVVDNASQDGSFEAFHTYKKNTTIKYFFIVNSAINNGFSAGNNKGIPHANGKYILFLNPDTLVHKNT